MYSAYIIRKSTLTILDMVAHTAKKDIGIQKKPMNKAMASRNFKHHPPSWMTAAQLFCGKIKNKMRVCTRNKAKVILKTAEMPKHALPGVSVSGFSHKPAWASRPEAKSAGLSPMPPPVSSVPAVVLSIGTEP